MRVLVVEDDATASNTAFPEDFTRTQAMHAGCEACLVKPVDVRTLPLLVSNMARRERNDHDDNVK